MDRALALAWLRETDPGRLETLFDTANRVRREKVGDEVHLRGLIEISNHCERQCAYCGIRRGNLRQRRYRLSESEVMACANIAVQLRYGTVVIQGGEDDGMTREWISRIIRRIKSTTTLAVTLSLGERPFDDLAAWREAGADRYLLRFETSNPKLYRRIHPPRPGQTRNRLDILDELKRLGYETGSGCMIGIPGQTFSDLIDDLERFVELGLDMIGIGPYLPHPATPLAREEAATRSSTPDQAPNDELIGYTMLALTRLYCPWTNIPSTTALATLNPDQGYLLGLTRGANVVMPNLTPLEYRRDYAIYPAKAEQAVSTVTTHQTLTHQIVTAGRTIARGRGDSFAYRRRTALENAAREPSTLSGLHPDLPAIPS